MNHNPAYHIARHAAGAAARTHLALQLMPVRPDDLKAAEEMGVK